MEKMAGLGLFPDRTVHCCRVLGETRVSAGVGPVLRYLSLGLLNSSSRNGNVQGYIGGDPELVQLHQFFWRQKTDQAPIDPTRLRSGQASLRNLTTSNSNNPGLLVAPFPSTTASPLLHIIAQHVFRRADTHHYCPQGRSVNAPPCPTTTTPGSSHRGHAGILYCTSSEPRRRRPPPLPPADSHPTGTDSSQGKPQIVSNINACLAVQATIKSTLGPYGGDLLMVDENGRQTITNDGATVMKLLDIVHPAARILVDIARSQDAEVGDGTTSVVVLAGEILKEVKEHVEQGVSSQTIVKGLRRASQMAVNKIKEIAVSTDEANHRDTLTKLAGTAMTSKLIKRNTDFFTKSEQNKPAAPCRFTRLSPC